VRQADQLRQAADVLESFGSYIDPAQHLSVTINAEGDEHTVSVHGTQPATLEAVERDHKVDTVNRDADGIVRYVALTARGVDLTWFRR
jgi:hypothetical protein